MTCKILFSIIALGVSIPKLTAQNTDFYGNQVTNNVCDQLGFTYDEEPLTLLNNICSGAGVKNSYTMMPCMNCPNFCAKEEDNVKYIFYNTNFLNKLKSYGWTVTNLPGNRNNINWSSVAVLTHEIGHHVLNHFHPEISGNLKREQKELQADRYAGKLLRRLGATLIQAQRAWNTDEVPIVATNGYPGRAERLAAIEKGYNEGAVRRVTPTNVLASDVVKNISLHIRIDYGDKLITREKRFLQKEESQDAFHYYIECDESTKQQIKEVRYIRNHNTFYEFNEGTYQSSIDADSNFDFKSYQWGTISNTYVIVVLNSGEVSQKVLKTITYDNK